MSHFDGSLIGLERQWAKKLAGIRTMALVLIGSMIFVSLSIMMAKDSSPTLIASQVVNGIGFLPRGIILRNVFSVTCLNTAAVGAMIGAMIFKEGFLAAEMTILVSIIILFSQDFDQITEDYQLEGVKEQKKLLFDRDR